MPLLILIINPRIRTVSEDVGECASTLFNISSGATPVVFSLQSSPGNFCPGSMGNKDCAAKPPTFNVDYIARIDTQGGL
jgi:hypothetical protein